MGAFLYGTVIDCTGSHSSPEDMGSVFMLDLVNIHLTGVKLVWWGQSYSEEALGPFFWPLDC